MQRPIDSWSRGDTALIFLGKPALFSGAPAYEGLVFGLFTSRR
jgi:hypothetical protein